MFTSFHPPHIAYDKEPDAVIDIPPNMVGLVIGKAGVRINDLQHRTNAAVSLAVSFFENEKIA